MKLQICHAYGAKGEVMERFFRLKKPALLLAIMSACLFGYPLHFQSGTYREFEAALLSLQWMLLACLSSWCGTFLFLTFSRKDWPLIALLLVSIVQYFTGPVEFSRTTDAVILLACVTLGKSAFVFRELLRRDKGGNNEAHVTRHSSLVTFLVGLVVLLAFASWWHLDMPGTYHGPRWMGLWNNPNDYGMLMGAGVVLAAGLLAERLKSAVQSPQSSISEGERLNEENQKAEVGKRKQDRGWNLLRSLRSFAVRLFGERSRPGCRSTRPASNNTGNANDEASLATRGARVVPILLFIAVLMMGVGLFFSYSRGAWLGTAIGLLYLAKAHGKFKWRWVLPPVFVALVVICFFWNNTLDSAPWYLKRMDLSRASAQHRVAAWKAGFEIMRDHPFGVGWNRTIETYLNTYSPPEGGAPAITTNDYLMLGTELGWPGLLCFVAYVGLALKSGRRKAEICVAATPSSQKVEATPRRPARRQCKQRIQF